MELGLFEKNTYFPPDPLSPTDTATMIKTTTTATMKSLSSVSFGSTLANKSQAIYILVYELSYVFGRW